MSEEGVLKPNYKKHPVMVLPSKEAARRDPEGFAKAIESRTLAIHNEKDDPLMHGWESPIWKVVDALYGYDCFDLAFLDEIKREFGEDWDWERWSSEMRKCLGFPKPVTTVLVLGGNRAGKSQYAAKRTVQRVYREKRQNVDCYISNQKRSINVQQEYINSHMPKEKRDAKIKAGRPEYINFSPQNGYTGLKFTTHNRSFCNFKYYTMDKDDAVEGEEQDWIWDDELVPSDWVETQQLRVASRDGQILVTFTPVQGYSETVRMMVEGATTVRHSLAFLCPNDTGEPLEYAALGFNSMEEAKRAKVYGPNSRPENVHHWIKGSPSQPVPPKGRKFKKVPRVQRAVGVLRDGRMEYKTAIVYFHTSDGPYGNPSGVLEKIAGKSQAFIRERFYGLANKTQASRFPKFNDQVHVIPDDKVPKGGSNYCFCDPSNGRNFVFVWFRVLGDTVYVYREWPGGYEIPGLGMPGAWAEVDGKKKDGKKGPAQAPFGWGLLDYKAELARVEGWSDEEDWYRWKSNPKIEEKLRDLEPDRKAEEPIIDRYIDARAAESSNATEEGQMTLLDQLSDVGLDFVPVHLGPAGSLSIGNTQSAVHLINNALNYDEEVELGLNNRPKLYFAESCVNTIFAMKIWTGEDGNKGACKDFVDMVRYFYAQDLEDEGDRSNYGTVGGTTY